MSEFTVEVTTNEGDTEAVECSDLDHANSAAKKHRTTNNHMVMIKEDSEAITRWDRGRVKGENRWRKVDVGAMQVLGPINEMARTGSRTFNVYPDQ